MRVGVHGAPFALDYTAVMTMGAALGVDTEMLADVLPETEAAILAGIREFEGGSDG